MIGVSRSNLFLDTTRRLSRRAASYFLQSAGPASADELAWPSLMDPTLVPASSQDSPRAFKRLIPGGSAGAPALSPEARSSPIPGIGPAGPVSPMSNRWWESRLSRSKSLYCCRRCNKPAQRPARHRA